MTKAINFKDIEEKIFSLACEIAKNITENILEAIDSDIMEARDKSRYRLKDTIRTSIKTVYGDVSYDRRYYYDKKKSCYIYLLDEKLDIRKTGFYSPNMVDIILNDSMNLSYRKTAESINRATKQNISASAAWKVVQQVGVNIQAGEEQLIKDMNRGIKLGAKTVDVLFQEADGVWLNMQKDKKKAPKQELKLATIYEGWKDTKRHELLNKKVIAGMETGKRFMTRRQAFVSSIYNIDEIEMTLLNGDGAAWIDIEEVTYKQLDQYHLYKEIITKISHKKIRKQVIEKLHNHDIDTMLKYIMMYADSIDGNTEANSKKAESVRELHAYLSNNRDGLQRYNQVLDVPGAKLGMIYRNMGVQENQNCTLVTMRMKHRRMRWSESGANNLAKVICSKVNGDLDKYIQKSFDASIPIKDLQKIEAEPKGLSAKKIPFTIGKGSKYAELIKKSVPVLNTADVTASAIRGLLNSI
ncbi:MAG: ISLre2 family transposase [Clostridium sp.]|nr:ISLre2 family transposase [Clostridium sp.]